MLEHKVPIGQAAGFSRGWGVDRRSKGRYTIVRPLPSRRLSAEEGTEALTLGAGDVKRTEEIESRSQEAQASEKRKENDRPDDTSPAGAGTDGDSREPRRAATIEPHERSQPN